ncbi:MAG TPA: Rieske 2Fe-2S domain-containing protein [Methanomassiliicoccales archaeon]|nr:Rieske 2Fe-2S domain-containing protein [Methanomassiliicoccales archaeon]
MSDIKVAKTQEISSGTMMGIEIKGNYYLIANVDGKFYAMDGTCSHMAGQLWKGTLDGFVVKCPKHGSRFDLRTGAVVSQVKIPLIGKAKPLKTYPLSISGDDISIDI